MFPAIYSAIRGAIQRNFSSWYFSEQRGVILVATHLLSKLPTTGCTELPDTKGKGLIKPNILSFMQLFTHRGWKKWIHAFLKCEVNTKKII